MNLYLHMFIINVSIYEYVYVRIYVCMYVCIFIYYLIIYIFVWLYVYFIFLFSAPPVFLQLQQRLPGRNRFER